MATEITEALQSALATVNATGKLVEDARNDLVNHNTDQLAHDDIREVLKRLEKGGHITEDSVVDLIQQAIKVHSGQAFNIAHQGWDDAIKPINERMQSIEDSVAQLEKRLSAIEGGGDISGPTTSLQDAIRAIEVKYAPQIQNLSDLISQATAEGNTSLANSYKQALQELMDQKNKEIIQATSDWVASQPGAPGEDE